MNTETHEITALKKRSDLHIARKVWHMSGVFLMFVLFNYLPYSWSIAFLIMGWLLFVPMDILRQQNPKLNDWVVTVFRPIMRNSEVKKLAGTSYLLSGVLLLLLFFPRPIASLTLLFLAFADPIASYVGIKWGRDKIMGRKSIQGTIAAFAVCATATFSFIVYYNFLSERVIVVSLIAGVIGALAELIPIWKLDDNFTLPLLSAVGLTILFFFFGITT